MEKLSCIMLIEDDETVNFYNEFLISELELADKVVIKTNGEEALSYLTELHGKGEPFPDLIFLDINMPVMNGFEFLEEYEKSGLKDDASALIVMLTTSLHPEDMDKAKKFTSVSEYVYKPLMEEQLEKIVTRYFKEAAV